MAGIFLRHEGTYVAMTEAPYDSEIELQRLIAQHPEMLADQDARERSLMLVRREATVNDREDGSGRWSLDHLYVDSEGVPTLVEVKRSSDTRGRREVVAQMLDYAANAKTSFSVDRMIGWVEESAHEQGMTAAALIGEAFGTEDPEQFWASVAANLQGERFRLVFVSDVIGPELRRIIEFLNGQMNPAEVLAIEVKQYVDEAGHHQTIVPRIIGDTEAARATKRTRSTARIDRDALLSQLADTDTKAAHAADQLLAWAGAQDALEVKWSAVAGIRVVGASGALLRISTDGTLEVRVHELRHADPPWTDEGIEQFLQRSEQLPGITFGGNRRQWPRTPLQPLADQSLFTDFVTLLAPIIEDLSVAPS